VRHRFVLSGFYQLPFKANRLVAGWEVGTVIQAQSGNPLNPTLAINPGVSLTVRPDVSGPIRVTGDPAGWFADRRYSFLLVSRTRPLPRPRCHPGNLSRNAVTGPNFVNTDFSVIKNTKLTERFNLQFRGEMFDIFNSSQFRESGPYYHF